MINIENFSKINELVSLHSSRKPKIVLDPAEEYCIKSTSKKEKLSNLSTNIIIDKTKWKISEKIESFISELKSNKKSSNEENILTLFERLCEEYTYDDNILSYMRKIEDDKFELPDWYGRDVDFDWTKNRENHNKRVCYEVSRILAKSLAELFRNNDEYNACILWDVDLTHYFVGLTCDEYTLTLDLDDFNNIKDLTRAKTGLTIEGINILEDNKGKFGKALEKFNSTRSKYAIKKISSEIESSNLVEQNANEEFTEESDEVVFLRNAIEVLKENYNIDSQGIFEYMKEIVDIRLGPQARKKVWKKLEDKQGGGDRYTRCLTLKIDDKDYIIDVDEKVIRSFDEEEFSKEDAVFVPYKELKRDWDKDYDGI